MAESEWIARGRRAMDATTEQPHTHDLIVAGGVDSSRGQGSSSQGQAILPGTEWLLHGIGVKRQGDFDLSPHGFATGV